MNTEMKNEELPTRYLPHRPPMIFIDRINSIDEENKTIHCGFSPGRDFFLLENEKIPEAIYIEVMAQTAACLKGWIDVHRGLPVKIGYLVGIEEANFYNNNTYQAGQTFITEAIMTKEFGNYFGFVCKIELNGEKITDAILSFMVLQ